jgi:stage II sporulation SpoE-like protein/PilZ domain-containing protein
MGQYPVDVIEWHILENADSSSSEHQGIHVGPFSSEEECRTVLASLKEIPLFSHGVLEMHRKCRRREKRIRMKLPVQVSRLSGDEKFQEAYTIDISRIGARLSGLAEPLALGEFLEVRHGQRAAVFRVAWIGMPGTAVAGQAGVECLSPENNIWDLDFSAHSDDEPLLQDLAIARAVQRKLLPKNRPPLRTLEYLGKCIQARSVGGDYYDFLDLGPERVGLVLADVAGKGVAAALLMANLQGSIRNRAGFNCGDLRGSLTAVNDHIYQHTEADRYATLFFGCYDDGDRTMRYVNCGHSAPLLLRNNGRVDRLDSTATVLGLFSHWDCAVAETRIEPGDLLTIYTDGVTETMGAHGEEFGEARLLRLLQHSRTLDLNTVLSDIESALEQFRSNTHPQDDVTAVLARGQ